SPPASGCPRWPCCCRGCPPACPREKRGAGRGPTPGSGAPRWGRRGSARRSSGDLLPLSWSPVVQQGQHPVPAQLEAALDLVLRRAVAVLALAERVVHVAALAGQLVERQHRAPLGLRVSADRLPLLRGHGDNQGGGGHD